MAGLTQLAPRGLPQPEMVVPTHLPLNQVALRDGFANRIMGSAGDGNEHTIAYDEDGNVVADQGGQEHGVAFTPEQQAKLKGARTIHNHHENTAMSGVDLRSAQKYGWKSLSVVGDKYIYNVEPQDGGQFQPGM